MKKIALILIRFLLLSCSKEDAQPDYRLGYYGEYQFHIVKSSKTDDMITPNTQDYIAVGEVREYIATEDGAYMADVLSDVSIKKLISIDFDNLTRVAKLEKDGTILIDEEAGSFQFHGTFPNEDQLQLSYKLKRPTFQMSMSVHGSKMFEN